MINKYIVFLLTFFVVTTSESAILNNVIKVGQIGSGLLYSSMRQYGQYANAQRVYGIGAASYHIVSQRAFGVFTRPSVDFYQEIAKPFLMPLAINGAAQFSVPHISRFLGHGARAFSSAVQTPELLSGATNIGSTQSTVTLFRGDYDLAASLDPNNLEAFNAVFYYPDGAVRRISDRAIPIHQELMHYATNNPFEYQHIDSRILPVMLAEQAQQRVVNELFKTYWNDRSLFDEWVHQHTYESKRVDCGSPFVSLGGNPVGVAAFAFNSARGESLDAGRVLIGNFDPNSVYIVEMNAEWTNTGYEEFSQISPHVASNGEHELVPLVEALSMGGAAFYQHIPTSLAARQHPSTIISFPDLHKMGNFLGFGGYIKPEEITGMLDKNEDVFEKWRRFFDVGERDWVPPGRRIND
jgi:hypothetical protein